MGHDAKPACGSWDFGRAQNTPDKQGWYLDRTASPHTFATAGFGVSIGFATTSGNSDTAGFTVKLCPGTLKASVTSGLLFSATLTVHTTSGSPTYVRVNPGFYVDNGAWNALGYGIAGMDLKEGINLYAGRGEAASVVDAELFQFAIGVIGDWSGTVTLSDVKIEPN